MGLCPADSRQGGCWCVPKYLRWERPEGTESSPYVCFLCIYFYLVHFLLLWYTIFLPIPLSHVKISCSSWTKIRFIKTYFKVNFFFKQIWTCHHGEECFSYRSGSRLYEQQIHTPLPPQAIFNILFGYGYNNYTASFISRVWYEWTIFQVYHLVCT